MELWTQPETWISLLTLSALEIVLGIDNIVFISILADKLPQAQRNLARKMGLGLALLTRLGLLMAISWLMSLTQPLFSILGKELSGRSLILLAGGVFLIAKATMEMFEALEVEEHEKNKNGAQSFALLMVQIMVLDIVFSLDSVITAVGLVDHISIMAVAMVAAVSVMLFFANAIGDFVTEHPSMKVLALSFLLLVGVMLVVEALDHHIPKGYIYFAMAFSLAVELFNMKVRKAKLKAVRLHGKTMPKET